LTSRSQPGRLAEIRESYRFGMTRLVELIKSLGNAGAVTNAGALASDRRREESVVRHLERLVSEPPEHLPARRSA
jgi:hypothetical protein